MKPIVYLLFTIPASSIGETSTIINGAPTRDVVVPHSNVRAYSIVCSGGWDNDYSFWSYVSGTLTITTAHVAVNIANSVMGDYYVAALDIMRQSYPVNSGRTQITSPNGSSLIAAERVIFSPNGSRTSYSEMMALRNGQLDTTYKLPWYYNVDQDSALRFGVRW